MFQKVRVLLIFLSVLPTFLAVGQIQSSDYQANSPYSRIGIGDISPLGTIRNLGLGGTGVSYNNPLYLNTINPALLINNRFTSRDSLFSILDGSVLGQLRRASDNNSAQTNGTVNFNSFAIALPFNKRWTTSVGIKPYSDVSYGIQTRTAVAGSPSDTAILYYNGNGGIYQADISNGFRITKNLNIGITAAYLFGSINEKSYSQLVIPADSGYTGVNQKSVYSGFLFRPGIAFRKKISSGSADSALYLNLGATYEFYSGVQAKQDLLLQRLDKFNIIISQMKSNGINRDITLPSSIRGGVSFDKQGKWNVAADFTYTMWDKFKGIDSSDNLKNSYTIALGSEFLLNSKSQGDLNSIRYLRFGLIYQKTPIFLSGNQINDIALTVGYSLPVGDMKAFKRDRMLRPQINMALMVGQRGTRKDNLVKDQYARLFVGITINDKWFKKRRVE